MANPLKTLEVYGNRYIQEYIGYWKKRSGTLKKDWLTGLDFFLSQIYFQGRDDELSERYYEAAIAALEKHFGSERSTRDKMYEMAWDKNYIPHNPAWKRFKKRDNPLWKRIAAADSGKERDKEMVMDILRFIRECPGKNVVVYSLEYIAQGDMLTLYDKLDSIYQIGDKVASFYLRDLSFIYDLELSSKELFTIQPIDTWVKQVAIHLGICSRKDSNSTIATKLLKACKKVNVDPKKVNAGAWYAGSKAFDLLLEQITSKGCS
jgi:hypothetical protein